MKNKELQHSYKTIIRNYNACGKGNKIWTVTGENKKAGMVKISFCQKSFAHVFALSSFPYFCPTREKNENTRFSRALPKSECKQKAIFQSKL
jgi:hypothetical protein